jgi:hypothetical protein
MRWTGASSPGPPLQCLDVDRIIARRFTSTVVAGLLGLAPLLLLSASAYGAAPAPVLGALPAHVSSAKQRVVNATFGAAPSSVKGTDGRPYFTFDSTPNVELTDHLAIINYSHRPERLSVYPVDAVSSTNGQIAFATKAAKRTQAGAWVAVGTPHGSGSIVVKPQSTDIVPIHVQIPPNASPGDHVGAVVVALTGLIEGKFGKGSSTNVKFSQRIAVKDIFHIAGPSHPRLTIESLKASYQGPTDPFAKGHAKVSYVVHNSGNLVLGGPQVVTVHGLFGEHVIARPIAVPPLLPGASYPVSINVRGVYPQILMSAKVTVTEQGLQSDDDQGLVAVSSSVHFLAIPWIIVIVVLLLVLGLAWWYWQRRRRRHVNVAQPTEPAPSAQGVPA